MLILDFGRAVRPRFLCDMYLHRDDVQAPKIFKNCFLSYYTKKKLTIQACKIVNLNSLLERDALNFRVVKAKYHVAHGYFAKGVIELDDVNLCSPEKASDEASK